MFTPAELAAEHARAMRIVKAVLTACDARAATARAARAEGFKEGDAPWVLAIGRAAIGMAEGMKDVCGEPRRHLIVTVDGPAPGSLTNIIRSDHPLPTQRSLDAGQAVKRFIEEAKAAGAPSLTVLMSGGASALICELIPGLELEEYREVVRAMLEGGWDIQRMNTVRRAIDSLKGGELAAFAESLPIDLFVVSDVIANSLSDIGSGPFVRSDTTPEHAWRLLDHASLSERMPRLMVALSCRPLPPNPPHPRRACIVADNNFAIDAAIEALRHEGFEEVNEQRAVVQSADDVAFALRRANSDMSPGGSIVWGGEWPVDDVRYPGFGGRCQAVAIKEMGVGLDRVRAQCVLTFATDGVDGTAPQGKPPAAGAFCWTGMYSSSFVDYGFSSTDPRYSAALSVEDPDDRWYALWYWSKANSYEVLAHRDAHRPPHEPPAHIFTGPTGTNVNDLLIAWRVK